jgi:predicted  nucleic acid-binding Zn-ribbon protein
MHPDLVRLAELTDLDTELDRVKKDLTAARATVEQAAGAEREATAARDRAAADLEVAKNEERALYRKIDEYKTRRQGAVRMLEMGAGSADAAEKQLAQCEAILDETETELLYLMERMDTLRAALAAADASVARAKAAHTEAARAAPGRIGELEAQEKDLTGRRTAVHADIPADLRGRYDLLRASKKRTAVARIVDGTCSACNISVQAQMIADVKRGQLVTCHGCQRWLTV